MHIFSYMFTWTCKLCLQTCIMIIIFSYRARGYKYDSDGNVEKQDKFLKRMSGIMRLYASLMVSYPPRRQSEHPFGIENAWIWLSRVMNIQPLPDVTATMVFDLLEVTGHALYKEYRKQFLKMLHILIREFLPKLKSVASSGGGGPVSRLEALIMASIQRQGQIPPPEGILSPNFWFSWWTELAVVSVSCYLCLLFKKTYCCNAKNVHYLFQLYFILQAVQLNIRCS